MSDAWDELWKIITMGLKLKVEAQNHYGPNNPDAPDNLKSMEVSTDWLRDVKAEGDKLKRWLNRVKAVGDDLKIDCEGFRKLATESTLRGAENRKKLEAVKSWVEYELIEYDKRRLHFAAYKLERNRHDRLIKLDKILEAS